MYEVRLDKPTLQVTRDFIEQLFSSFPINAIDKEGRIPEGVLELVQGLIKRTQSDWHREASYFGTLYGSIACFDNRLLPLITRLTVTAELSCKCNAVVCYGNTYREGQALTDIHEAFNDRARQLLELITAISNALQKTNLRNGMKDTDTILAQVRKHRLRYASHLADLAVELSQKYFRHTPELPEALRARARLRRNYATLLIDLARDDEILAKA